MRKDCPFNLNVSLTVIDKAFHDSLADGFQAIKYEAINAVSRGREIMTPGMPFPDLTYEIVNGRLHWPGDKLSVVHHLRRNIVWLNANGGTEAQLDQAKLDLVVFLEVQNRALGLGDGLAVMWLAQKTPLPTDGVALQQIRREGDKLIQSSQLLPFDQQFQIDNFQDQINKNRDDVSVDDSVGGWIVQGEAVDFQQELPELIDQAQRLPQSDFLPMEQEHWQQQFPLLPEQMTVGQIQVGGQVKIDRPIQVSSEASFWFGVMAAAQEEKKEEMLLEVPTSPPAGEAGTVLEGVKPVEIKEIFRQKQEEPTRRVLAGAEKEKVKQAGFDPIGIKETPASVPTRRVLAGPAEPQKEVIVVKPTREKKSEKKKEKEEKIIKLVWQRRETAKTVVLWKKEEREKEEKEIPIYNVKWPQLEPLKDIPEWIWQGQAAVGGNLEIPEIVVLAIFFLLVNTKARKKVKISNI